ncbi:MAG: exosortase/archaeosortase family protein [Verrucomicrobiales bacterium]|nr:exosortase/archaeosortase family protein [Verrucomicrobiales bacterium]
MNPGLLISLAPVLGCFIVACSSMRHDWTYDETYHYGWTVLPLTAYLIYNRWQDRPESAPAAASRWRTAGWIAVSLLLALTWLIREANPDWRLAGISLTFCSIAAALLWLTDRGGSGWRRHFAGAVGFFAISIPWPSSLEKAVTTLLMPANAAIALEVLHWLGIPAVRQGNLIQLAEGTLGVEEACSGIRSLQSTLMMALFLGELHRLKWLARIGLTAAGMLVALLTNASRTVVLSFLAARHGLAAAEHWHDLAGISVLVVNAALLFLLTRLLSRHCSSEIVPSKGPQMATPIPTWHGSLICAAALVLLAPLVWAWYGLREQKSGPQWAFTPPQSAARFRFVSIDKRTSFMLRSSRAWSAKWNTPLGHPVHCYYIEWDTGKTPPENMNVHPPGGCLATLGIELDRELDPISLIVDHASVQARLLRFVDRGMPLYVAYLVTSDGIHRAGAEAFDFSYARRLRAALHGVRNSGQRMLEVGIWGATSEQNAREEFTAMFSQQIQSSRQ